jgi:ribosomal protein L24E
MALNKCQKCGIKLNPKDFFRTIRPIDSMANLVLVNRKGKYIRYCSMKCKNAHHHTGSRRYNKHVQKLRNEIKHLRNQLKMRGFGEN